MREKRSKKVERVREGRETGDMCERKGREESRERV